MDDYDHAAGNRIDRWIGVFLLGILVGGILSQWATKGYGF